MVFACSQRTVSANDDAAGALVVWSYIRGDGFRGGASAKPARGFAQRHALRELGHEIDEATFEERALCKLACAFPQHTLQGIEQIAGCGMTETVRARVAAKGAVEVVASVDAGKGLEDRGGA